MYHEATQLGASELLWYVRLAHTTRKTRETKPGIVDKVIGRAIQDILLSSSFYFFEL